MAVEAVQGMVFFNWATMQMAAKIVYYGPGLCGKTSNLSYIYAKTAPNSRGEMVSLETESDRTLFFDLLPIEVGTIGGFKTRLQLYTVPGQVFYNTTRKLVLKGVDGLVFVADSQRPMREANLESFESLRSNLDELGVDMADLPLVLQYNKRDLKNTLAIEELNSDLNADRSFPFFESEAINGAGVFETLKEITKLTLKKLRKRMVAPHAGAATGARPPSAAARPSPSPASNPPPVSAAALARAAEEGVDSGPPVAEAAAEVPGEEMPQFESSSIPAPELTAEESPFASDPSEVQGVPMDEAELEHAPESDESDPFAVTDRPSPFAEDSEVVEAEAADELDLDAEPLATAVEEVQPITPSLTDEDSDVSIEFDQSEAGDSEEAAPPMKRVRVSNQMDILAELEELRKQATMHADELRASGGKSELDIDALLAGTDSSRELRRKVEQALNSDVFSKMRGLQLAVRIQNEDGETIHTLEPVSLSVEKASKLKTLSLQFTVKLENHQ
jgi:signal recognition particle receptor subunit beta